MGDPVVLRGDWYLILCGTVSSENLYVRYREENYCVPMESLKQWTRFILGSFQLKKIYRNGYQLWPDMLIQILKTWKRYGDFDITNKDILCERSEPRSYPVV